MSGWEIALIIAACVFGVFVVFIICAWIWAVRKALK